MKQLLLLEHKILHLIRGYAIIYEGVKNENCRFGT